MMMNVVTKLMDLGLLGVPGANVLVIAVLALVKQCQKGSALTLHPLVVVRTAQGTQVVLIAVIMNVVKELTVDGHGVFGVIVYVIILQEQVQELQPEAVITLNPHVEAASVLVLM